MNKFFNVSGSCKPSAHEQAFVTAFSSELLECAKEIPQEVQIKLHLFTNSNFRLLSLFRTLNQVFLDFLAQLRGYYLNRDQKPTFHSVILARACLKNAFCQMYFTICGRFAPNEGRIAGYVT